jgi:hypothetical protein
MGGMGIADDAVRRHRERQDPIGRLPWPVRLLVVLAVGALAVAQIILGSGVSRVLGLALLVFVVPPQLLATWAAWKVATEDDDTGRAGPG